MPEFCRPEFVNAPPGLEDKLQAFAECLKGVKPGIGVELVAGIRGVIREAHHALALRSLQSGGEQTALGVFERLQTWRCLDQVSARGVLTALAVAQEVGLMVKLLRMPMSPAQPKSVSKRAKWSAADPMAAVKERIRELHRQGASCKEICRLLDQQRFSTPERAEWRSLTWQKAYELYRRAVQVWIAKAANRA